MSLSHAPPTYYYNPEYVSVSANPLFALTQETTNHDIIITYDICVVYLYVGTVRGHVVITVEIDKHVDKEEAPPTKEFAVVGLISQERSDCHIRKYLAGSRYMKIQLPVN